MHKIKIAIKHLLIGLINCLVFPSKEIQTKSLLIIKLDAIGDYIIFRNFLEITKNSDKYKDYEITLLGNDAWKDLAIELDSSFINNFIWINRAKFNKKIFYRYSKMCEITAQGYEVVVSPVYSRDYFIVDNIVKMLSANLKIGSVGENNKISQDALRRGNKYYTSLISANSKVIFEFYRNKEFFEALIGSTIYLNKPNLKLNQSISEIKLPTKYAVLFIGAGKAFRRFDIKNYVEIAFYLQSKYKYKIVLCGGKSELEDSSKFQTLFKNQYTDLVGKTSLLDLCYIVSNSDFIIANESSAPHISASLNVNKTIVISNGNHYGRFTPYPKEVYENYVGIFPDEIYDLKAKDYYGKTSELDINKISLTKVFREIDNIFKK